MLLFYPSICFVSALFFYFNFFRHRLAGIIPFQLTEFSFYLILVVCWLYIYIIYRHLFPKKLPSFLLNAFMKIAKPLIRLDIEFRQYIFSVKQYEISVKKLIMFLEDDISFHDISLFNYLFYIIPRVFLITVFLYDVLLNKKIETFYYFLFLGLLPLVYQYFIYVLRCVEEHYYQMLEQFYTDVNIMDENCNHDLIVIPKNPRSIYDHKVVTIRKYFEIQSDNWWNNDPCESDYIEIQYKGYPFSTKQRYQKYSKDRYDVVNADLTFEDYEILSKEFYNI